MKRYLLLMLPLALAACTPPAPEASTPATDAAVAAPAAALDVATLSGHYWQLSEAKAADGTLRKEFGPETQISLHLEPEDDAE